MKPVGHLAPPFWFHSQVPFCRGNDTTGNPAPPGVTQGRVTKTTNFSGFAVNSAAMLAGFYHRSVLRCGCLAERNPGVEGILAGARTMEKKSFELSRIEYPVQHGERDANLWKATRFNRFAAVVSMQA
jgi:hypothetical protein